METNYKLAERLYQIKEGLSKVIDKRQAFPSCVEDLYKDETMAIMGARDRIDEIATELARDKSVEQEIDKQEQDEVDEHFEERQMDAEEKEARCEEIADQEDKWGEQPEGEKEHEIDISIRF